MSDADLIVVHTFNNRQEADLAKSALEAAGIDADPVRTRRRDEAGDGVGRRFSGHRPDEDATAAIDILEHASEGRAAQSVTESRVTNYDAIASGYDRRYTLHNYDGVRDTVLGFLGSAELSAVLEVGCGTGHWLQVMSDRARLVAGLDVSGTMLERARSAAPSCVSGARAFGAGAVARRLIRSHRLRERAASFQRS